MQYIIISNEYICEIRTKDEIYITVQAAAELDEPKKKEVTKS